MRRLPPLQALRAFEAAARNASITGAAAELRVSHSAVSQHVRNLEQYFGQALFQRTGRRVTPTPAALLLLEEVRSAFDRISDACEQFALKSSEAVITLNATPSFAMRWLIPRTSGYQIANPQVKIIVDTSASDGIDHLSKPYDYIFRRFPLERADYACHCLLPDRSTPVCAPALVESLQDGDPRKLLKSPLLHLKSRPDAWKRWFERCGVPVPELVAGPYFDHFFLSLQAAISSLGVALGPLCLVDDDVREGRLATPFPDRVLEGPGFHVLVRASARGRHHRTFLEALVAEAEGRGIS